MPHGECRSPDDMVKTRIILIAVSAALISLLFLLPKVVVENESQLDAGTAIPDSSTPKIKANPHDRLSKDLAQKIKYLRARYLSGSQNKKNAIFADSLATLYSAAGKFDSAGWFSGEASSFFNTKESFLKAGQNYYEAFTFAVDAEKQKALAEKARYFFSQVLTTEPKNLDAKTKMAMTYISSSTPMKGILMLREVLEEDPKNEPALFNMGMLSIQSGQYDRAIERLRQLISVNPKHIQAQLLLGIAYMNKGDKTSARLQFEKVKQLDKDPSVQATADSYLKDLK
jgi:tetratricopeptide (TPR) repeat protein